MIFASIFFSHHKVYQVEFNLFHYMQRVGTVGDVPEKSEGFFPIYILGLNTENLRFKNILISLELKHPIAN